MFPRLGDYEKVAIDTETTGVDWFLPEVYVFSVAIAVQGMSWYFDAREYPGVFDWLADECKKIKRVVAHNLKFDYHMLAKHGVRLPFGDHRCTMIRAALIDEHRKTYNLDDLGKDYLGIGKVDDIYEKLAAMFGGEPTRKAQMPNLHRAPASLVAPYGKRDAELTLMLDNYQDTMIDEELYKIWGLEQALIPVIIDMEERGVPVDVEAAHRAIPEIEAAYKESKKQLDELVGFSCNPNPSGDMVKIFRPVQNEAGIWVACDGTELESTPAGKASVNADALERMEHPAAKLIVKCRKLAKIKGTFLEGHILGHQRNGIIHPNINQIKNDQFGGGDTYGTGTGRLSYNSPALQQIPSRDELACKILRSIFIPGAGCQWGCWDYKQFEFRMFAHYINNVGLNDTFTRDPLADFHQMVADLSGLPRTAKKSGEPNAKQLNLGMVFSMGGGLMAKKMGMPYTSKTVKFKDGHIKEILVAGEEAQAVMEKYHAMIPSIRSISQKATSLAEERGYVQTLMGRRLRFPGKKKTYKAAGLIYQGSSADCMKQKLVEIYRYLQGKQSRILLSVHDEFNLSLHPDDGEVNNDISEILETYDGVRCPIRLRIPIRSTFGKAENWYLASDK